MGKSQLSSTFTTRTRLNQKSNLPRDKLRSWPFQSKHEGQKIQSHEKHYQTKSGLKRKGVISEMIKMLDIRKDQRKLMK